MLLSRVFQFRFDLSQTGFNLFAPLSGEQAFKIGKLHMKIRTLFFQSIFMRFTLRLRLFRSSSALVLKSFLFGFHCVNAVKEIPVTYISLAVLIVSRSDHCAVRTQT